MFVEMSGKIFAGIYSSKNEKGVLNRRRQDLITNFAENIFKDEYFVLYSILKKFPKLSIIDEKFLMLYLNSNKASFLKERSIDLGKYAGVADSYNEFCITCVNTYKSCVNSEVVSDEEFILAIEQYRIEYINEQSIILMQDSAAIMTDGMPYGRRTLNGFQDMQTYMKRGLQALENLDNGSSHIGIITYGDNEPEDMSNDLKTICEFGIEPLDKATGGMTEGDMISILGVAKGGKSRFMTYLVHRALMQGVNVVVWSVENGVKGWEALLRARHFDYKYNSTNDVTSHCFISDNEIRKGTLTGVRKDKEAASWLDLRTNKEYGKLTVIDEPFDINSYIETLDTAVKQGSAKLVAVDYLQLIGDSNGSRNRNEVIAEAYQKSLRYLKANKLVGLFPAQVKQTSVSSLSTLNTQELGSVETRDIAGASYEVVKTPDINIALIGSVEDIKVGHLVLVSMPSRNSAPFDPTDLSVDFGACNYMVMNKDSGS